MTVCMAARHAVQIACKTLTWFLQNPTSRWGHARKDLAHPAIAPWWRLQREAAPSSGRQETRQRGHVRHPVTHPPPERISQNLILTASGRELTVAKERNKTLLTSILVGTGIRGLPSVGLSCVTTED